MRIRAAALAGSALIAAVLAMQTHAPAAVTPTLPVASNLDVWLCPAVESADLLDLYRHPERWPESRSRLKVMKFAAMQLEPGKPGINTYDALNAVGAFSKLRAWGIRIASEEGAIKEWDCSGQEAAKVTARNVESVARAGGRLDLVAMDEPAVAGTLLCKLSLDEVASRTAAYAEAVRSSVQVQRTGTAPMIGDIEPYPFLSAEALENWLGMLERHGFVPAFLHIDVDIGGLAAHPGADMTRDLRSLARFMKDREIPLGVIFWSGHDPMATDREYFEATMDFARRIKHAIGQPQQSIFESWIHRSPPGCSGVPAGAPCPTKTIPLNLPDEGADIFSHTRLINQAMRLLAGS
jgi:hypothetical protein